MILCGHRGVASLAPENTLAGLREAHRLGLEWVEIDVQLTRDEQVVVIHDEKVNRCTNGKGWLRQYDRDELGRLDAGSWFDPAFSQERIPLLTDYLTLAATLGIRVNIELKLYPQDDAARLCRRVSEVIEQHGFDKDTLLFSSFEPDCLRQLQMLQPDIARALLVERIPYDWQTQLQQLNCTGLNCHHRHLTRVLAEAVKAAGYRLNCYTVNHTGKAATLAAWGVDMIFTDTPQDYLNAGWRPS
ncbi:glycerophosphoryl diester phosphodiesterase [Oceanisphaera arctica]|uniref:Glycerophosphoryl diester phosphodiesterase n=1 Tax=Oceanisphaera arctica TaxID=641510 RepID=A0A2P5TQ67_9GAMM|nr:glycerophosphoryl diester phosphodiesterase [Oceanisphaera arctica]PPL17884.1 glycerophosphoryl diester phosphodiesterase [Oceanisphaera arctica]GHA23811.1 glycerophosphoryl diester phosphodiesterase [Oceanisphaera arctica]